MYRKGLEKIPSLFWYIYLIQTCKTLPDIQQFHFKYKRRETRDRAACPGAITHFRWDIDSPFVANVHLLEGDLPTVYHITETESFRTIPFVGIVELLAVDQSTFIVYTHDASERGRDISLACFQNLIVNAARKGLNSFLCGLFFQELNVLLFIYFFFTHVYSNTSSPIRVAELEEVTFTFTKSPMWWLPRLNTTTLCCWVRP